MTTRSFPQLDRLIETQRTVTTTSLVTPDNLVLHYDHHNGGSLGGQDWAAIVQNDSMSSTRKSIPTDPLSRMQGATSIEFGSSVDLDDLRIPFKRRQGQRPILDISPIGFHITMEDGRIVEFVRTGDQLFSLDWDLDPTQTVITGDASLAIGHGRTRIEFLVDQTPVQESVTADVDLKVWAAIREMSLRDQIELSSSDVGTFKLTTRRFLVRDDSRFVWAARDTFTLDGVGYRVDGVTDAVNRGGHKWLLADTLQA